MHSWWWRVKVDMAVSLAKAALNPMAQEVLMMRMMMTMMKIPMVDTKCPTLIPTPKLVTSNQSLHRSERRKNRWR